MGRWLDGWIDGRMEGRERGIEVLFSSLVASSVNLRCIKVSAVKGFIVSSCHDLIIIASTILRAKKFLQFCEHLRLQYHIAYSMICQGYNFIPMIQTFPLTSYTVVSIIMRES